MNQMHRKTCFQICLQTSKSESTLATGYQIKNNLKRPRQALISQQPNDIN